MVLCALAFYCCLSSPWMLSGVGMFLSQFHSSRSVESRENLGPWYCWDLSQLLWLDGLVSSSGPR